ncbi:MAG: hypothetical protein LLG43_13015 [Deltaproteobacteria bacterium]|nr:hypothetical protein [Deltaproteobacteria bacterium]
MAMVAFVVPVISSAADTNACVRCHTSDQTMKSLVKPPVIQGEGEG